MVDLTPAKSILDEYDAQWFHRIDLEELDMDSYSKCILGQLFGEYYTGVKELFSQDMTNYMIADHFCYHDQKWKDLILDLRKNEKFNLGDQVEITIVATYIGNTRGTQKLFNFGDRTIAIEPISMKHAAVRPLPTVTGSMIKLTAGGGFGVLNYKGTWFHKDGTEHTPEEYAALVGNDWEELV